MWSIKKYKYFRKFEKFDILELFFGTLDLALYYYCDYCGDRKQNTDFFQMNFSKESKNMVVD